MKKTVKKAFLGIGTTKQKTLTMRRKGPEGTEGMELETNVKKIRPSGRTIVKSVTSDGDGSSGKKTRTVYNKEGEMISEKSKKINERTAGRKILRTARDIMRNPTPSSQTSGNTNRLFDYTREKNSLKKGGKVAKAKTGTMMPKKSVSKRLGSAKKSIGTRSMKRK
jgi:hypothetical protein